MNQITFDDTNCSGHDPIFDCLNISQSGPWDNWWMTTQMPLGNLGLCEGTADTLPGCDGYLPAGSVSSYETNPTYYSPWPSPVTDETSLASTYGQEVSNTPTNEVASPMTSKSSRKRKEGHQPSKPPSHQRAKGNSSRSTATKSRSRRDSRASGTHHPNPQLNGEETAEMLDLEEEEEPSKRVQLRNRVASNKFRSRKRADAIKLTSDEKDMERINRELSNCVADLTQDVYNLKMQLLQHTGCDCKMIQKYISNEAHRYVETLQGDHEVELQLPQPQSSGFFSTN